MSTPQLLPPPPGFLREKKFGQGKVRYVYPFAKTDLGMVAADMHEAYLEEYEEWWRHSKLRRLAIKRGKAWLCGGYDHQYAHPTDQVSLRQLYAKRQRKAFQIGINLISFEFPIFVRRNPLDQVFEHLQGNPRYYLKLDLKNAFGSVYPGFHPRFPRGIKVIDGEEYEWTGWPFFHPGNGGLIQGAPASPLLFDQVCVQVGLDRLLRESAKATGATVTRYVDDTVFSSREPFGDRFCKTLRLRIEGLGFSLNEEKSRRYDTRWNAIEFLGVRLFRNRISPRPAFFDRLKEAGVVTNGHLVWIDQVNQLNHRLEECRKIWQHQ